MPDDLYHDLPVVLPAGPVLTHLTKNRVSHRPNVRPPTSHHRHHQLATPMTHPLSTSTPSPGPSPVAVSHDQAWSEGRNSANSGRAEEEEIDSDEEKLFIETTV